MLHGPPVWEVGENSVGRNIRSSAKPKRAKLVFIAYFYFVKT